MVGDLIVAGFAGAAGFVAAGLLSSFYQLVTASPVRFEMSSDRMVAGVAQVILLMFTGPVVLMRNAIRGRIIERRPLGWLVASAAIAAAWSLCSGVVVLEFALALRSSLA
jgi:hypothetical protein